MDASSTQPLSGEKKPRKKPCLNGAALDVRAGAAFLGGSEKQLRAMVDRRIVPFRRLGSRIIFIKAELEQWLSALDGCTAAEAQENVRIRQGGDQ